LQVIREAEQDHWDAIAKLNLDAEKVRRIYMESATWAEQYS
jgi:hypothetical protein